MPEAGRWLTINAFEPPMNAAAKDFKLSDVGGVVGLIGANRGNDIQLPELSRREVSELFVCT